MEKDIGKIRKNETTDIVVRVDDFGGKVGLTVREYTTSDRYTGFTKSGTRIPAESIAEFKQMINSIDESELQTMQDQIQPSEQLPSQSAESDPSQQQLTDSEKNETEEISGESNEDAESTENPEEIKEEVF